jgi:hypothetical protein
MSAAAENADCVYACIAVLAGLYGLLALRMSMFRLAGSPGEAKPNSPLNRFSEVQLLTAEWIPVGAVLALALVQKGALPAFYRDCLFGTFTVARVTFAAAKLGFIPGLGFPLGVASMVSCYLATFGMAGALVAV